MADETFLAHMQYATFRDFWEFSSRRDQQGRPLNAAVDAETKLRIAPIPDQQYYLAGRAMIDPDGLIEYSVVYTDRSLNHMSQSFQGVMKEISSTLKQVYNAHAVAIVPGSGTYGMEAVARQLATGQKCLVLRNGWFSYRWTQIFDMGSIPASHTVMKARRVADHTCGSSSASHWSLGPTDWLESREPQRARIASAPNFSVSRSA
jgi:hypothetical protein